MWFRQSGQRVRGPGDRKEQMGRLLAPPGPGLPQSQAPNAGSPRVPVPRHRGASSRNRDPRARWRLSALLKCPCCLCCVGLAEPRFIQEMLGFTSSRFSEASAGPPVDSSVRCFFLFFFSVLAFWGFNSLPFAGS